MALYTVRWEINIDAPCAKDAAEQAWNIMKEPVNEATYLDVYETKADGSVGTLIRNFDMDEREGK